MSNSIALPQVRTQPTRRRFVITGALGIAALNIRRTFAAESAAGISYSAEAIHQEPTINAKRHRVYETLTAAKQFDRLMALSDAVNSMPAKPAPPRIDARAGGEFALFGRYISGRFIELVPDELIVQAWRASDWGPGRFSIARFELHTEGAGTKILFDHTGFPIGEAEHLAQGWYANYWRPLQELLT
jgi:activator of HSP90 ATPase